jgi:hypothetical protein
VKIRLYECDEGFDAINISNILTRKEVVKEIPPYFKNQSVPIVSYSYTNSIGRKSCNYKVQFCVFKGEAQNLPLRRVGLPLAVPRG